VGFVFNSLLLVGLLVVNNMYSEELANIIVSMPGFAEVANELFNCGVYLTCVLWVATNLAYIVRLINIFGGLLLALQVRRARPGAERAPRG